MSNNRESVCTIDLLKLVGSMMIFTMHMSAFLDAGGGTQLNFELLTRWGVPFFFIVSAYFLYTKNSDGDFINTIKYTYRIASLYGIWFLFNIPSIFYFRLWSRELDRIDVWLNFLKNSLLSSTFTGSWYLLACIGAAWFIFLANKIFSTRSILLIGFFVELIRIVVSIYSNWIPNNIYDFLCTGLCFPLNILSGVFYFALGKWFAENKNRIQSIPVFYTVLGIIISEILFFVEIYHSKEMGVYTCSDAAFSLIPLSCLIFILSITFNMKCMNTILVRKLSTIIYCSQGNVMVASQIVLKILQINSSFLRYIVGLIMISSICVIVMSLQRTNRFKWAKYMT